ncbi:hypothetical protein M8818_004889 [Zalaria obscura]|uniref:Uncharacterized protein n=1 Tax=Zalaria obscura TaxID=2024903 RepID=A0ACC3SB60_9PEZI
MTSYEAQRLENIRRNQALIKELGITRAEEKPKRPAPKKRKLSHDSARPVRVSARIASAPAKPSYNEDALIKEGASVRAVSRKRASNTKSEAATITVKDTGSPPPDLDEIRAGWTAWKPVAAPPTRDENGTFHFESHPTFLPNKSPAEMLAEGAFGGSYYRRLYSKALKTAIEDDWKELPDDWLKDLNIEKYLTSPQYDPEVNKFKVKCGQSIEEWEANGWIAHDYDVRGWFQWYIRFWLGRRCDDDDRQVGRWDRCVGRNGRWRRMLLKKYIQAGVKTVADEGVDEEEVSPVMHQTCHHWAWEVRQDVLDEAWQHGL